MSDHKQLEPPDYHRCLEQVLSSPASCLTLLDRLSEMNQESARSAWSPRYDVDTLTQPTDGQGPLWQNLYDVMGVPVMQMSNVELIWNVRMTIERLKRRIVDLETELTDCRSKGSLE